MSSYPFWLSGVDVTPLPDTPSNSVLMQMFTLSTPASTVGVIVYAETAPDVVTYPDLVNCQWHKLSSGARTGYLYYYNGTAWTPMKVSPGALTGDSFADNSIDIDKLEPGTPNYVIQTNSAGNNVIWVAAVSLFAPNTFPLDRLVYAGSADQFMISSAGAWEPKSPDYAAGLISVVAATGTLTTIDDLDNDGLVTYQAIGNSLQGFSHRQYPEALVNAMAALTTTDVADKVLVYDTSGTTGSKVKVVTLANLLPDTGVAPGTYNGFTVNSKGQITAVPVSGAGTACTLLDTGASGYAAQSILATTLTPVRLAAGVAQTWCAVASNAFTLLAGTYIISATVPLFYSPSGLVGYVGLYTAAGTRIMSANFNMQGDSDWESVTFYHVLVVDVSTAYEIRAYGNFAFTCGTPNAIATIPEVYQQVLIQKIA